MKGRFRRCIPDSLSARISLAFLASIVLLFIVNIRVVCFIQLRFLSILEQERSDTIASVYLMLYDMNRQQRESALKRLTGFKRSTESSLSLELVHEMVEWEKGSPLRREQAAQAVATLESILSNNAIEPLPDIQAQVITRGHEQTMDSWAGQMLVDALRADTLLLQMRIRLDEGAWLDVTQPLYLSISWLIWMQRLVFFVEFAAFAILVILLMRRLLTPLHILTHAADTIGKRPEVASPLPESGCREIREASQAFNRMQARIQANLEERNRMLAAMAHDLRTPLTRVQLRIEEVESALLRDKLLTGVKEVQSIAEQGLELSSSLQTSEEDVSLDLHAFLQSCIDDFIEMGCPVSMDELSEPDPIVIKAKPMALKRCVDNLIRNAITYAGRAQVHLSGSKHEVGRVEDYFALNYIVQIFS